MNFRALICSILFIPIFNYVVGQDYQPVTIILDVSGYSGKLPKSSHPIWEGNDTLVPLIINAKIPEAMGAEYLVFPHRLEGDSLSPRDDAARSSQRKIWRSKAAISNNIYTWHFTLDKPCVISHRSISGNDFIILPGDSISITYQQDKPVFSGRGAAKFRLMYDVYNSTKEALALLQEKKWPRDLIGFLENNRLLNEQTGKALAILDAEKSKISQYEYNWIKAHFLAGTEYTRWLYFYTTPNPAVKKTEKFSYTSQDLVRVWDSTMYRPEATWYRSAAVQNMTGIGSRGYIESFIVTELHRNLGFLAVDSIENQQIFKKLAYNKIKSGFTGLFRERLLCYFVNEEVIQEMGSLGWFAQSILQDYYSTPGFPAYKQWVKQMEMEHQYVSKSNTNGGAPLFSLKDQEGNIFTKKNTEGKFAVINFWYTGCEPCLQSARELSKLQEQFKNNSKVVFLNVSVDPDKTQWQKSITEGKYVPKGGVQLYTGGLGKAHEAIQDFHVTNFPTIRLYDHNGRIAIDEINPFATKFSIKQMNAAIEGNRLMYFKDGPYIFHENGITHGYYISDDKANPLSSLIHLSSATDQPAKDFHFPLQKNLKAMPAIYPAPSKMLVLSDIEGNFGSFRQLLQANGIIDENYNWRFGQGHLVLAGDMFDRGSQVTECLWLIYSLEAKAKTAGGMVHFILGNHEIMNLQGNHNYVHEKYLKSAELMDKSLTELYNENSELGRWLRTKNIVEKIGNMLFLHGGISRELAQLPVSIAEINQLARPYYGDRKKDYGNEKVNYIMSTEVGPFWYRGYYKGKIPQSLIDSTLQKFHVTHIVTGHTIVADTISVHYDGKVINTDIRHASGNSEALLVEGDIFYRVSSKGNRKLLFRKRPDNSLNTTSTETN